MAIAYVGTTQSTAGGTNISFAHNVGSGSNRLLIVACHALNVGPNTFRSPSSVTYNGVAMAFFGGVDGYTFYGCVLYYLVAPDTGSNNVVITYSASVHSNQHNAVSFDGAHQTTPIGAKGFDTTESGTTLSVVLSELYANSWSFGSSSAAAAAPFTATIDGTHVYNNGFFSNSWQTVSGSYTSNAGVTEEDTVIHSWSLTSRAGLYAFEIRSADGYARISAEENIKFSETVTKQTNKALSENLILTEAFSKLRLYAKSFTENLILSESVVKNTYKSFVENLILTESITKKIYKSFVENVKFTETVATVLVKIKSFTENLILTESIKITKNGVIVAWDRTEKIITGTWDRIVKATGSFTRIVKPTGSFTRVVKPTGTFTRVAKPAVGTWDKINKPLFP